MTEEEIKAHTKRVEDAKANLRSDQRLRPSLSYDEAVFKAAKPALKRFLSDVAVLPDISEYGDLFAAYETFCISQIRAIVDTALCVMLSRPCAPVQQRAGRRERVVTRDNDLLVPRAKRLVNTLEGRLPGTAFSNRYVSILVETEDLMNTTNWKSLARSFYNAYAASS